MAAPAFTIHLHPSGGMLIVEAVGPLDADAARTFETTLRGALWGESTLVLLDLSGLESIHSDGLDALIAISKLSGALGDKLEVRRQLTPKVERTLDASGAAARLPWEGEGNRNDSDQGESHGRRT
jgi:anti-anti-sigma factor